jgi:hypothetical protein
VVDAAALDVALVGVADALLVNVFVAIAGALLAGVLVVPVAAFLPGTALVGTAAAALMEAWLIGAPDVAFGGWITAVDSRARVGESGCSTINSGIAGRVAGGSWSDGVGLLVAGGVKSSSSSDRGGRGSSIGSSVVADVSAAIGLASGFAIAAGFAPTPVLRVEFPAAVVATGVVAEVVVAEAVVAAGVIAEAAG